MEQETRSKHNVFVKEKNDKHQFNFPNFLLEKPVMIFFKNKGVTGLDLEDYPKINL